MEDHPNLNPDDGGTLGIIGHLLPTVNHFRPSWLLTCSVSN